MHLPLKISTKRGDLMDFSVLGSVIEFTIYTLYYAIRIYFLIRKKGKNSKVEG
ncbi:hypothetical protein J3D64_005646 [Priestia megaterium]|nr:hypothetical protein [Priestia megaterium]